MKELTKSVFTCNSDEILHRDEKNSVCTLISSHDKKQLMENSN